MMETGRGKVDSVDIGDAWADAAAAANGFKRASSCSRKRPSPKAATTLWRDAAGPAMGTGGRAGAWRMSSMLWIGVMPQIGSLAKGQPYASAPMSLPST